MKYIIDIPDGTTYVNTVETSQGNVVRCKTISIHEMVPYKEIDAEKDEIHVGDEVEYKCCDETVRYVVTEIVDEIAYGFKYPCNDVDVGEYCDVNELTKTGRSFPEITELLRKMNGE